MANQSHLDVVLAAMQKDRAEVYARLKQMDKIIKGLQAGDLSVLNNVHLNGNKASFNGSEITEEDRKDTIIQSSPVYKGDAKILILKIFDTIGKACKLRHVQDEYAKLTGTKLNIREPLRTLNKSGKVLLMKEKNASRGIYWVKSEWVDDGLLLDEFKPEDFNLLYDDENLEYIAAAK